MRELGKERAILRIFLERESSPFFSIQKALFIGGGVPHMAKKAYPQEGSVILSVGVYGLARG